MRPGPESLRPGHSNLFLDFFFFSVVTVDQGQRGSYRLDYEERSHSRDEELQFIDDDENDESPTDDQDLWLPERNEENTKFERSLEVVIPCMKYHQSVNRIQLS